MVRRRNNCARSHQAECSVYVGMEMAIFVEMGNLVPQGISDRF